MQALVIIAALTLLFGCATTEKYERKLSSMVGQTEAQLLSGWGEPQKIKELANGDRLLSYRQTHTEQTGGMLLNQSSNYNTGRITSDFRSATTNSPRSFAMPTTPTKDITLSCTTHFTIHQGVVQAFHWEGDDCVSSF